MSLSRTILTAAFALWECRYRDEPDGFLAPEEVARMEVATVSEQRAIYLGALLREVCGDTDSATAIVLAPGQQTDASAPTGQWFITPAKPERTAAMNIAPGHVYVAQAGARAPYARSPSIVLSDAAALPAAALASLLSDPSSASTDNTSALLGLVSKLSAMALAVRNRSYVLMAASISEEDTRGLLLSNASLRSKASVASFTDMLQVSLVEIDHCAGDQPAEGGAA